MVFNGYFFKIWKYEAGDVPRGTPLLVGKIGWGLTRRQAARSSGSTLRWSLVVLGVLFLISLGRWIYQLGRLFVAPGQVQRPAPAPPPDQIDPAALDAWARSARSPNRVGGRPEATWDEG